MVLPIQWQNSKDYTIFPSAEHLPVPPAKKQVLVPAGMRNVLSNFHGHQKLAITLGVSKNRKNKRENK